MKYKDIGVSIIFFYSFMSLYFCCGKGEKNVAIGTIAAASHNLTVNFARGPSYPWTVEDATSAKLQKCQEIIKPFIPPQFFKVGTSGEQ